MKYTLPKKTLCAIALAAVVATPLVEAVASCVPEPYLGSVCMTSSNFCPRNYTPLAGQVIAISSNQPLYSLLGCQWGGNCSTTFALPDMRGRAPIGVGQGPGLTDIDLGQSRGAEISILTTNQLPTHNHGATFTPAAGSAVTGKLEVYSARASSDTPAAGQHISGGGGISIFGSGGLGASLVELQGLTVTGGGSSSGGTVAVGNTGESRPFSIEGPRLALTYCMVVDGLCPPRP